MMWWKYCLMFGLRSRLNIFYNWSMRETTNQQRKANNICKSGGTRLWENGSLWASHRSMESPANPKCTFILEILLCWDPCCERAVPLAKMQMHGRQVASSPLSERLPFSLKKRSPCRRGFILQGFFQRYLRAWENVKPPKRKRESFCVERLKSLLKSNICWCKCGPSHAAARNIYFGTKAFNHSL